MKLKQTHLIALANQKGGCGKTTAAVNIAAACAQDGFSVCLVDTDEQCNATTNFGFTQSNLEEAESFTIADAYIAKKPASEILIPYESAFGGCLAVVPGNRGIGAVEHRLEAERHANAAAQGLSDLEADNVKNEHRLRLRNSLNSLRGKFDIVFIDTPPSLGFLMTSALIAADAYIVPLFPSNHDLGGLEKLIVNVGMIRERYNPNLKLLGILLGSVNMHTKLDQGIHALLTKKFGEELMLPIVGHTVRHREATVYCKSLIEHVPNESSAEQLVAVARDVVERLRQSEGQGSETGVEVTQERTVERAVANA